MIDITQFDRVNIIDTCSIWNILSSNLLFQAAINAKSYFYCTKFVLYECLYRPRKSVSEQDIELQQRLEKARAKRYFPDFPIDIEDLNDIDVLLNRKKLSKGELSSMVFAKRMDKSFLTDDQKARKLAAEFMDPTKVQTTPMLLGWLIYEDYLGDTELDIIIRDHKELKRPLEEYFREAYLSAMQFKLYKRAE